MRLTPELILQSDSSLNTLKDRHLDLRGNKIPALENLGVTRNQNDSIDLTDNDIRSLANLPSLPRLHTLILANNLVTRIDRRLAKSIPSLETLILTNNSLSELASLDPLARFPRLTFLSLMGNPVARQQHYREYVVWRCKHVRVLDFQHVKEKERERAKELMETADGRPSALATTLSSSLLAAKRTNEDDGMQDVEESGARAFEVGSVQPTNGSNKSAGRRMTADERKALEEAIENSTSLDEIKRLEDRLKLGYTTL